MHGPITMVRPKEHLVFVYGTLKKGFRLNSYLGDSKFLGEAHTLEGFAMRGYSFPYIARKRGGHQVCGEVYRVSEETLLQLDYVEGNPSHYQRRRIWVAVNGKRKRAWIYLISLQKLGRTKRDEVLPKAGILTWV